jgi:adenylosuccinate synthase
MTIVNMKKDWKTVVIVGAQWGDEGKGKVTDYYGSKADYVVRFQGGNNAGHTISHNGQVLKLHLLPSGVMHPRAKVVIANGVVIDPKVLFEELALLKKVGLTPKLLVSDRAHLIFPWHIYLDSAGEVWQEKQKLSAGSTGRGIWPAYADKAGRVGIRVVDLLNPGIFKRKFDLLFNLSQKRLSALYGSKIKLDKQKIIKQYMGYARLLLPMVADTSLEISQAIGAKKKIFFEGAQGAMLDVDHGLYPYTTSSNTMAGAVCSGAGVSPHKIDKVIGVVKAYLSRVGGGYLPTELKDKTGDYLRETGAEYGTTTGRARRIGWLDLVQLRYSARINGLDSLAITKIDIMDGLQEVKVCTAYKVGKKIIKELPADLSVYDKCLPVYKTFKGWPKASSAIGKKLYKNLPINMKKYLEFIEKEVNVPIEMVSVGPERNATIIK